MLKEYKAVPTSILLIWQPPSRDKLNVVEKETENPKCINNYHLLASKIVAVVGGMAPQKQQRLLQKRPEIIVATPGRLWDLISEVSMYFINIRCTDVIKNSYLLVTTQL